MSEPHRGQSSSFGRWTTERQNKPSIGGFHRPNSHERTSIAKKAARKLTSDLLETSQRGSIAEPLHQIHNAGPSRQISALAKKTARKQEVVPRLPTITPRGSVTFNFSAGPWSTLQHSPGHSIKNNRRISMMTPSTPLQTVQQRPTVSKSAPIFPPWQKIDEQNSAELVRLRKDAHSVRAEPVRRWMKVARKQPGHIDDDDNIGLERRTTAHLGRNLRLIVNNGNLDDVEMDSVSDEDSDGLPPPNYSHFVQKVTTKKLTAVKSSARKLPEYISDEDEDEESPVPDDDDARTDSPLPTDNEGLDEQEDSEDEGQQTLSEDEIEFIEDVPVRRRRAAASMTIYSPPPSPTGLQTVPPPEGLSTELLRAMKPFLPQLSRKNIPMRISHLRRAFMWKCIRHGVMTAKIIDEYVLLQVMYRLQASSSARPAEDLHHSYTVTFDSWKCPLCSFHGSFNTRQMLKSHLEWDHEDVEVLWDQGDEDYTWRIILTFPQPSESNDHPESRLFIYAYPIPVVPASRQSTPTAPTSSRATPALVPEQLHNVVSTPVSRTPSTFMDPPTTRTASPAVMQSDDSESQESSMFWGLPTTRTETLTPSATRTSSWFKFEPRSPSPDSLRGSVPATSFRGCSVTTFTTTTEATTGTTTSSSIRQTPLRMMMPGPLQSSSDRRPTKLNPHFRPFEELPLPPPYESRNGPAARPPFLPAETPGFAIARHGWVEKLYMSHSCRPGGERIYDLLGVLPLDEYGLMSWAVLDREEEIFDSDDMMDECKVICALWARWIFLNRRKFIADYYLGAMSFIDQYSWMIYWAAGWAALRYWLIILMANKFLKVKEVANLLKHYSNQVQMDRWYIDDDSEGTGRGQPDQV